MVPAAISASAFARLVLDHGLLGARGVKRCCQAVASSARFWLSIHACVAGHSARDHRRFVGDETHRLLGRHEAGAQPRWFGFDVVAVPGQAPVDDACNDFEQPQETLRVAATIDQKLSKT
jgi:hypothetical protein